MEIHKHMAFYISLSVIAVLLALLGILIYKLIREANAKKSAEEKYFLLEMKVNDLQLETLESKLNPICSKTSSIQSSRMLIRHTTRLIN